MNLRAYAFLRTGYWIRMLAVAVLVSLGCTALGYWQWNRHTARLAAVERVEANYDAAVVPLQDVLGGPLAVLPERDVWRPASAGGTYATGGTVILRNRPVSGTPAVHVLAPLVVTTADGQSAVLVVDRGWLPAGSEESSASIPNPPSGAVAVVAHLRQPEAPADRDAPPGQVYAVAPSEVLALGAADPDVKALPVLAAYGILADEVPASRTAPARLPRPDTDLGTHLSYTFQWWVFAIGALVGFGVLARREATGLRNDDGVGAARPASELPDRAPQRSAPGPPAPGSPSRRSQRRRSAEQEEDALIDAQLAAERPTASEPH